MTKAISIVGTYAIYLTSLLICLHHTEMDELALHSHVSSQIRSVVEDVTGSHFVGEKAAEMAAYGKEAMDLITGGEWSERDLAADMEGIYGHNS